MVVIIVMIDYKYVILLILILLLVISGTFIIHSCIHSFICLFVRSFSQSNHLFFLSDSHPFLHSFIYGFAFRVTYVQSQVVSCTRSCICTYGPVMKVTYIAMNWVLYTYKAITGMHAHGLRHGHREAIRPACA